MFNKESEFFKLLDNQNVAPVLVQCDGPNIFKIEKESIHSFYILSIIHVHVLMLPKKFELVPIKF